MTSVTTGTSPLLSSANHRHFMSFFSSMIFATASIANKLPEMPQWHRSSIAVGLERLVLKGGCWRMLETLVGKPDV